MHMSDRMLMVSRERLLLKNSRGFTLLELMVTMVVVAMLVAAAYRLFDDASAAMYEVDSLSHATDRARFGLELIARDIQGAGSFGSTDSRTDALAHGDQASAVMGVQGVYSFERTVADLQVGKVQEDWNQNTRSDELILLGAYDFPFSFEVSFDGGDLSVATARNTMRGALRFEQLDPFFKDTDTTTGVPVELGNGFVNALKGPGDILQGARLLRVMDRNGYSQFAPISAIDYTAANGIAFALPPTQALGSCGEAAMGLCERFGDEREGLEPAGDDGTVYDAALLDMIRYRVCQDPNSPSNLRLVRERLDAPLIISTGMIPPLPEVCGNFDPAADGILSQEVLVDRVADFRVWYDCAPPNAMDATRPGAMIGLEWHAGWEVPGRADEGHNCTYTNNSGGALSATGRPGFARIAHVRLSVRTEGERADLPNFGFMLDDGNTFNTSAATNAGEFIDSASGNIDDAVTSLQTFDTNGDASDAARVVTLQIDTALKNFANRERIRSITPTANNFNN